MCIYFWMAKFFIFIFLETFVAVSDIYKKKKHTFGQFAIGKIKRLLIPCWLYSILYYILFLAKNIFMVSRLHIIF